MSVPEGTGIVLQPEEGQSHWQPIWANGYSIVKLSPKHGGPDDLAMGVQVIAPGGYVRELVHEITARFIQIGFRHHERSNAQIARDDAAERLSQ